MISFAAYARARTVVVNPFIINWYVASSAVVQGFCVVYLNGAEIGRTEIFPVGSVTSGTKSGNTFCIGGAGVLPANTIGNITLGFVGVGGTVSNQQQTKMSSSLVAMCFIQ